MDTNEPIAVAILAKAPIPGFAKTRLIAALGAEGAAALQARLIERAVDTACSAGVGPVVLWCAPDETHAAFAALRSRNVMLKRQPEGDLGARMLGALKAAKGPALVIGTDCPALTAEHVRLAADVLRAGSDVVILPAEDGGYVLIGTRVPQPALFSDMRWSNTDVMEETRRRLRQCGMSWREPAALWDVDVPADIDRLRASRLANLIPDNIEPS